MSTNCVNGIAEFYGSSPKELQHLETRIQDMVYGVKVQPTSKNWTESSLDEFPGVKWTASTQESLDNLASVWMSSLVEKENHYKLPDLTVYLALHFPQVDDLSKRALDLLDPRRPEGTTERSGFSDLHCSEAARGKAAPSGERDVQFQVWYDQLPLVQRVAFASFLATALVRLCNESASEVKSYLQNSAMDDFQTFQRVSKVSLSWIPLRSLEYLQVYLQSGNQLLVSVLAPFLRLRDQLQRSSAYPSLLNALEQVLFSPTAGKELHLVDAFKNAAQQLGVTHAQLMQEMTGDLSSTRDRMRSFIDQYELEPYGTWQWARYFSKEYFSDLQAIHNKKAATLLNGLAGSDSSQASPDSWVTDLTLKYGTKRERASSASYEGFWDGARRIDYV